MLALTLVMGLVTGALTGFIASKCGSVDGLYDDKEHWDHVDKDEVEIKQGSTYSTVVPRRSSLVAEVEDSDKKNMMA